MKARAAISKATGLNSTYTRISAGNIYRGSWGRLGGRNHTEIHTGKERKTGNALSMQAVPVL